MAEEISANTSHFKDYKYVIDLKDIQISCLILKMTDSYSIWLGTSSDISLYNLYVSHGNYSDHPQATLLYSQVDDDDTGDRFARLLAKKFRKVFFVSVSIRIDQNQQKELFEQLHKIVLAID
ncbi:hypothetical protein WA158_001900 [Blastocystis sp. Blastoise]